jgi:hypothetical protein
VLVLGESVEATEEAVESVRVGLVDSLSRFPGSLPGGQELANTAEIGASAGSGLGALVLPGFPARVIFREELIE